MASLFKTLFSAPAPTPAEEKADPYRPLAKEADQFAQYKREALHTARLDAEKLGVQPTLDHYRKACERFGQSEVGKALVDEKGQSLWRPEVYADLSGQEIKGFLISDPKLKEPEAQSAHAARKMSDAYDLDGDGQVNAEALAPFYDNINLDGAALKDCIVDPATSFNDQFAKAAEITNVTFNNMQDGDKFTFGSGEYNRITLTNIKGGEIQFNDTKVNGLNMNGAKVASITMSGHTSISHLKAEDAHIVRFTSEPGAEIHHANFTGATIDMGSKLNGIVLQDVMFKETNLVGVDLSGAKLTNVKFKDCDVKDLSLHGATLTKVTFKGTDTKDLNLSGVKKLEDVTINGHAIASTKDLEKLGVTFDKSIEITASKEHTLEAQLAQVTAVAKGWNQELTAKAKAEPVIAPPAPAKSETRATSLIGSTPVDASMDYFTAMNKDIAAPKELQEAPHPFVDAVAKVAQQAPVTKLTAVEVEQAGAALSTNQAVFNLRKVQPAADQVMSRSRT